MIDFKNKSCEALSNAIAQAGHWVRLHDNVPVSSNDAAVQAIIDGFDPIPNARNVRIMEIKVDGLARINAAYPAITSLDEIAFYADFWLSIAPAARVPNAPFKKVIDIYSAAKVAIAAVNAATTQALIDAVAVNWPA